MKTPTSYHRDHIIAKAVICVTYILLGIASIEANNPYFALVLGTTVWFFGVNFAGYVIENLLGHEHNHNIV